MCDRVVIINQGRIVEDAPLDDLIAQGVRRERSSLAEFKKAMEERLASSIDDAVSRGGSNTGGGGGVWFCASTTS